MTAFRDFINVVNYLSDLVVGFFLVTCIIGNFTFNFSVSLNSYGVGIFGVFYLLSKIGRLCVLNRDFLKEESEKK